MTQIFRRSFSSAHRPADPDIPRHPAAGPLCNQIGLNTSLRPRTAVGARLSTGGFAQPRCSVGRKRSGLWHKCPDLAVVAWQLGGTGRAWGAENSRRI
jgi:hypothetical protein